MYHPHFYKSLPGFFDFEDLYLEECARIPDGGSVVEVGVWCGRSLAFLLVEFLNRGKWVTVHGVDLFERTPEMPKAADLEHLTNILRVQHLTATLHKGLSWEMAAQFPDASQDMVFVDASHDLESVRKDLRAWHSKVKPGGTFAGHDFTGHHPGVVRAVREFFPAGAVRQHGSCWVATR